MDSALIFRITIALVVAVLAAGVFFYFKPVQQTVDVPASETAPRVTKTALFAGGCFWCVEADLEKLPGVVRVTSGYASGESENPTYSDYASSGHREVVEVEYAPDRVTYAGLVEYLIKHIDPTDAGGSFYDRGFEYNPAVYYETQEERAAAQAVFDAIEALDIYDAPLVVALEERPTFYPAEEYHQDYYLKNPLKYRYYRAASGRDRFIDEHWGENTGIALSIGTLQTPEGAPAWQRFEKPSDEVLREQLTSLQYYVTQQDGTEPPFANEYWDNTADGIYVDVVSGEPLFSSTHKYKSGTGWPSFTQPLVPENIMLREDRSLFTVRTEVRSLYGDSHVGHVFSDGPPEAGGLRYCMNSAALRFIPKEELAAQGYGEFTSLFE